MTQTETQNQDQAPAAEAQPGKFDEATVILTVTIKSPGNRRKVDEGTAHVEATDGADPSQDSVLVSKELFKSPIFKAIGQVSSQARAAARLYALSSGDYLAPGSYLVPVAAVDQIFAKLDELEKARLDAISRFLEAYPQIVSDAKARLGGLFCESDYPAAEVLREAFLVEGKAIRTRVRVRGSVPQKGISRTIYERELKNAENEVQGLMREVRDGLRAGLLKLVSDLVSKVKEGPGEDGKRFVVGPKLDRVKSFLAALPLKDVTKDDELQSLAEKARAVLDGVDAEAIRDNEELAVESGSGGFSAVKVRDRIVSELGDVAKTLDGLVEKKPTRKITFEEDEVQS